MNSLYYLIDRLLKIEVPIQVKASLVVLSAQLCFSGWHIVGSVAFRSGTDPLVFILYRLIFGTTLMQLYVMFHKLNTNIDPIDHRRMYIVGLLSFGNVFFGSMSLKFIAPARFAIFQPSIPCIVTGISMLFKLEEMNRLKICGIALAVAGAFLAELWKTNDNNSADESNVPLGVFLATSQVFSMGFLLVAVKPLLNKYDPAVVSATYFLVTTLAIMIVVICRVDIIPPKDYAFGGKLLPWLAISYVAVFATMYSFSAINWGGKYLPPTVTTVFFTFQPVGTIILSATLLGAVMTLPEILGGLLIIAGLLVTSLAQSMSNRSSPTPSNNNCHRSTSKHGNQGNTESDLAEIEFNTRPRVRSRGSSVGSSAAAYNPIRVEYTAVHDVHVMSTSVSEQTAEDDDDCSNYRDFRKSVPDVNIATV